MCRNGSTALRAGNVGRAHCAEKLRAGRFVASHVGIEGALAGSEIHRRRRLGGHSQSPRRRLGHRSIMVPAPPMAKVRSGPPRPIAARHLGAIRRVRYRIAAYFSRWSNDQGGVNGRRNQLISLDDAYSPPKRSSRSDDLESDEVRYSSISRVREPNKKVTPRSFKNHQTEKVPHLFVRARVLQRYSMIPSSCRTHGEDAELRIGKGEIYSKYILSVKPDAKLPVCRRMTFGRDICGFRRGLGDRDSRMIVSALIIKQQRFRRSNTRNRS